MKKVKPTYKHPDFVLETLDNRIEKENKRLWLSLLIDKKATESLLVILKNPSRATKDSSDKTVYTVTNYIYRNKKKYNVLKNVGTIIIINLIPYYETYSDKLASSEIKIIDKQNEETIFELTSRHKNVIIAWGDHPKGLRKEYEEIKKVTLDILKANKNSIYFVDKISNNGNPKHGQVWSYDNRLKEYNL
jgi:hypothetical protein